MIRYKVYAKNPKLRISRMLVATNVYAKNEREAVQKEQRYLKNRKYVGFKITGAVPIQQRKVRKKSRGDYFFGVRI